MSVPLADEAVSTSGDYERYFDEDGVRYHHIISPSTGAPAREVHSATVIGPDAVMTDALSTSVFVMGVRSGLKSHRGLALLRKHRHRRRRPDLPFRWPGAPAPNHRPDSAPARCRCRRKATTFHFKLILIRILLGKPV